MSNIDGLAAQAVIISGEKTCGNCDHRKTTDDPGVHLCFRFPPTVNYFVIGMRKAAVQAPGRPPQEPIVGQHSGYPPVGVDWPACGEHKPRSAIRND